MRGNRVRSAFARRGVSSVPLKCVGPRVAGRRRFAAFGCTRLPIYVNYLKRPSLRHPMVLTVADVSRPTKALPGERSARMLHVHDLDDWGFQVRERADPPGPFSEVGARFAARSAVRDGVGDGTAASRSSMCRAGLSPAIPRSLACEVSTADDPGRCPSCFRHASSTLHELQQSHRPGADRRRSGIRGGHLQDLSNRVLSIAATANCGVLTMCRIRGRFRSCTKAWASSESWTTGCGTGTE